MLRRDRAEGREAGKPVLGGAGGDPDLGIRDEAVVEGGPLDPAFLDPAVAGLGQQVVGPSRRQRRQAPDRWEIHCLVRGFEGVLHLMCQRIFGL